MSALPRHAEPEIFRVDTVPPPAGESDLYAAPTKVGPMSKAFVDELMKSVEPAGDRAVARSKHESGIRQVTMRLPTLPAQAPGANLHGIRVTEAHCALATAEATPEPRTAPPGFSPATAAPVWLAPSRPPALLVAGVAFFAVLAVGFVSALGAWLFGGL